MRYLLILLFLLNDLIAHGSLADNTEGFSAYIENQWDFKSDAKIEHSGLSWRNKISKDLSTFVALTHHNGASWNSEDLIETLYVDYFGVIHVGRIPTPFGYKDNFSNRPYIFDKYMPILWFDGFAIRYVSGDFGYLMSLGTGDNLGMLGFDYKFNNNLKFILYFGKIAESENLLETSNSLSHSHSHGNSDGSVCDNLSSSEICISDKKVFYSFGIEFDNNKLKGSTKLVNFERDGTGENKDYLVDYDGSEKSVISEILYKFDKLELGLRYQTVWFERNFYGDGSSKLAQDSAPANTNYIKTISSLYKISENIIIRFEIEDNDLERIEKLALILKI